MQTSEAPPPRWLLSLRLTFSVALTAMVALTAFGIIVVTWRSARQSSLEVSDSLMQQTARIAEERLAGYLQEPVSASELILRDIQTSGLDPFDRDALEARLYNSLTVYESLSMMAFADQDGDFLMVKRQPDGALWTKQIRKGPEGREVWWSERLVGGSRDAVSALRQDRLDKYDPRARPWYQGAERTRAPFWTDIYVFFTDRAPGVTLAVPYLEEDELVGVVAVDVSLVAVSSFLATLEVSDHGRVYVLDAEGRLVGTPDVGDLLEGTGDDLRLQHFASGSHPELVAFANDAPFASAVASGAGRGTYEASVDGAVWMATLDPVGVGHTDWMVAVMAPQSDFLAAVERNSRRSTAFAIFFALIAIVLSLVLARTLSRSLERLVIESHKVQSLDFDDRIEAESQFREVFDALAAFDGMKTGLRSLQKYIPMNLVRVLLERQEEPELGGELLEVTVFFSDIQGFTTISEQLEPAELAHRLGQYLGTMTQVIQDRHGTVTHYIGDGVMAFWGAPNPVEDHPIEACAAALECQKRVEGLWAGEPGAPAFHTRIGLHTARVAVGHFGTEERMAYTALGDGVNLASRLEGLGKYYGVRTLVSQDTYEAARAHFEARRLDFVRVKGRSQPIGVYELLGHNGRVSLETLAFRDHYEAALDLYRARQWDAAIARFDDALSLRPDDQAARVLRERCAEFRSHPPDADWQGDHTMDVK